MVEKVYNEFIEEAKKLHSEMEQMDTRFQFHLERWNHY